MEPTAMASRDNSLPLDVIFEILSRSSLTTIGKCRQLSKACNSLTYESSFVNLHCQRSNILSGFFLPTLRNCKRYYTFISIQDSVSSYQLSFDFFPVNVLNVVASTPQGILVCVDERARTHSPRYYVCKPSTKEWQAIPNPKTKFQTQVVGMIVLKSNPLHYKIVRFSRPKSQHSRDYYSLMCESFDSMTMVWKQHQELVKLAYGEFLRHSPPVSSSGSLHWLTTYNNILAFHQDKDDYSMFSIPNDMNDHYNCFQLVEYEGKLGLTYMAARENSLELQVLQNYEQKVWSMEHTISLEQVKRIENSPHPLAMYNADTVLMSGPMSLIFFKFRKGSSVDEVKLDDNPEEVFPFRSDFEPCNLSNEYMKKLSRISRNT